MLHPLLHPNRPGGVNLYYLAGEMVPTAGGSTKSARGNGSRMNTV